MSNNEKNKNINIEDINFEYVSQGGKVKMIAWGKDYLNWDLEHRLEYSEALASAMNEACDLIQKERNSLLIENSKLKDMLDEANIGLNTQRKANINSITIANQEKQELIKTIRQLEEKFKASEREKVSLELKLNSLNEEIK